MDSWWEEFNINQLSGYFTFQINEEKELNVTKEEGDENNWSVGEQEELVEKLNEVAQLKKAIDVDVDSSLSQQVGFKEK